MTGLYIHIPFCKSRCLYCAFCSTTHLELRQRYVDALCQEMVARGKRTEVSGERIKTIYLGGGTPSQLTVPQLRQIFQYIYKVYGNWWMVDGDGVEVTIELNPDDVTAELAAVLRELGVNRVSMGAQTFSDDRLRFLHRRHTADQTARAAGILREAGIRNVSIDLMYGFPEETLSEWHNDISHALALNVEHLSAYALQYEEGTPLYKLLTEGKLKETDEETERRMYYDLIDRLNDAGFEHYEISNFAKPGFRSRHNSGYWNQTPYIGLGAAAHSFDRRVRQWNTSDITRYIEGIENGTPDTEHEVLDADTRYNDIVMTALRTKEGLNLDLLTTQQQAYCRAMAQRYIDSGLLKTEQHSADSPGTLSPNHQHTTLSLTREGLFVSDMIMSDLFIV